MRTTIILDPEVEKWVIPLASQKKLSQFVNRCIKEHFRNEAKKKLEEELSSAYCRANQDGKQIEKEFEPVDLEEWPEW